MKVTKKESHIVRGQVFCSFLALVLNKALEHARERCPVARVVVFCPISRRHGLTGVTEMPAFMQIPSAASDRQLWGRCLRGYEGAHGTGHVYLDPHCEEVDMDGHLNFTCPIEECLHS